VSPTLVLAAGGIVDGRSVAGALALGADGVWVGTRLVATSEAMVHSEHKRRLVEGKGEQTVRSSIFGPESPHVNPMRVLRNRVVDEWTDRLSEISTARDNLPLIGRTRFLGQEMEMRKAQRNPVDRRNRRRLGGDALACRASGIPDPRHPAGERYRWAWLQHVTRQATRSPDPLAAGAKAGPSGRVPEADPALVEAAGRLFDPSMIHVAGGWSPWRRP